MKLQNMCIIFGTLIFLQTTPSAFGGIKCLWSSQTLQRVTLCPGNKGEMEVRAKKKNCESIAHEQNCTKPENFKYHCVMNALGSALIEVCAPEYRIHGYCTEYNEVGTVIQEHYNRKCTNVTPPCASTYLSTDSYLYKGCNEVVKNKILKSSTKWSSLIQSTPGYANYSYLYISCEPCTHLAPMLYPFTLLISVRGI